jgi:hypothetical protein
MITALFPKGSSRTNAAQMYATIVVYINSGRLADAQALAFKLLDFTLKQYYAGKLIGGYSLSTQQQVLAFEIGLYCTVGLPSTGLQLPGDPTNTGIVDQVVFPSTTKQSVTTKNGAAGVFFPANSLNSAVLVTITPLTGNPLNTKLDQYGPFSDVNVSPASALGADVSVGICASANFDPATVFLAHNVSQLINNVPTPGIEILPPGTAPSGLCGITTGSISGRQVYDLAKNGDVRSATKLIGSALVDLISPTNANATGGGITGTTRSFSPFGGVDTKVYMTANSTTTQSAPAGSAVQYPPSTLVKTNFGTLLPKVNVLFSVTSGGGTVAGGSSSTVTTDATGVATVSNWVINTGSNTVQAVGTYADPTVTFRTSTISGFPQAVTVDPTAGITFTATGTDVVPYGSSYTFLDGAQGHDLGFESTSYDVSSWNSGSGPFGSATTACPLNHETGFTMNTAWTVGNDLTMRKNFPLPSWWTAPLTVTAAIDNDIQVFVNGHPLTFDPAAPTVPLFTFSGTDAGNYAFNSTTQFVTHENCATKGSLTFSIPASFLNLGGQNTLAIRARDRGSINYVDVKVTAPAPQ